MSEILNSVNIGGPIAPYDSDDLHPTHHEEYGRGGFRSVEDMSERDAIPEDRRKEGMQVYLKDSNVCHKLSGGILNTNWCLADETLLLLDLIPNTTKTEIWVEGVLTQRVFKRGEIVIREDTITYTGEDIVRDTRVYLPTNESISILLDHANNMTTVGAITKLQGD